jgi:hypothetical protein
MTSASEAPLPVVSGEPVAVAEGVYVISDNHVPIIPNIGIVVGDSATLVIDTGLGRDNGAYVLEHARRLGGGRPVYVATTHVDPGHGFDAEAAPHRGLIVGGPTRSSTRSDTMTKHCSGIPRVTFQMDLAALPHATLMRSIELLGREHVGRIHIRSGQGLSRDWALNLLPNPE